MRCLVQSLGVAVLVLSLGGPASAWANASGAIGYSGLQTETCSGCHAGGGAPTVTLSGPTTLQGGATGTYTLTISGGAGARAGFDIAVDSKYATLQPVSGNTALFSGELTHSAPLAFNGGQATVSFRMVGPQFGGTVRLFAAGLSANGNGATSGDGVRTTSLTVNVTGAPGAPLVEAVTAGATEVRTASTPVSVTALDDGPEGSLTYTWSVGSGPGTATFTPNGTNAAKQSTVQFSQAGDYTLSVLVKDAANQTSLGSVAVKVVSTPRSVAVSPQVVGLPLGGKQQFTARLLDQFAQPMPTQPTFRWSASLGGGTVTQTGLFTAGNTPTGTAVPLSAQDPQTGLAASASVTVGTGAPPSFAQPPSAQVQGLTARLHVLGADDGGETQLRYLWEALSGPGTVTFDPNDSHAAKDSTATFTAPGQYTLGVTVKDATGLTHFGALDVTVGGTGGGTGNGNGTGAGTGGGNGGGSAATADLRWVNPLPGARLTGRVEVEVQYLGQTPVQEATFLLDDAPVGSASSAPFRVSLDTCAQGDGPRRLVAALVHADGSRSESPPLEVEIANGAENACSNAPVRGCASTASTTPLLAGCLLLLTALSAWRRRHR